MDLDSAESVAVYDNKQGTDHTKDDALLDRFPVGDGTVFVDLGTGTGSLPVQAALRGAEAHAVDVSENMISFSRRHAKANSVNLSLRPSFIERVESGCVRSEWGPTSL